MNTEEKQSLITDINEAKQDREENTDTVSEQDKNDAISEALENTDFELSTDQSIEEQVQNLHGKLLVKVVKKIQVSGGNITQQDISAIAQTIIKIMEQKMMFYMIEKMGIDDITDLIGDDAQEEIVDIFGIKSSLDVSKEDLAKIKEMEKRK